MHDGSFHPGGSLPLLELDDAAFTIGSPSTDLDATSSAIFWGAWIGDQ